MQQVRRNADEISKVNAMLGELQNKLASGNSNIPQSADTGDAIVRVITIRQPQPILYILTRSLVQMV